MFFPFSRNSHAFSLVTVFIISIHTLNHIFIRHFFSYRSENYKNCWIYSQNLHRTFTFLFYCFYVNFPLRRFSRYTEFTKNLYICFNTIKMKQKLHTLFVLFVIWNLHFLSSIVERLIHIEILFSLFNYLFGIFNFTVWLTECKIFFS